jgi:uncharacterized membrane protein
MEIFFTALYDIIIHHHDNPALKGQSYGWMLPIYGLAAYAFPPLIVKLKKLGWPGRGLLFGVGILIIEYMAGFALKNLTGACPWEYKEGWHLHGFIRFDFYPLWVLFAMALEKLLMWLKPRLELSGMK